MKKWVLVEEMKSADGKTVSLYHQDGVYQIRLEGVNLMSTRQHASEEKLAEIACEPFKKEKNVRILIGGLGFGFTLRATLKHAPKTARVLVAELMAPIISWNRNPVYRLAGVPMGDRRVTVIEKDVADVLRQKPKAFDIILMDVDNGPRALSADKNSLLYQPEGLKEVIKALKPGGCVGFWSVAQDPFFEKNLKRAGFAVKVEQCRAHATSGGMHTLFFGYAPHEKPKKAGKK